MTTLAVRPDTTEMGSQETLPIGFDVSALLSGAEAPSEATAELIQVDTGTNYTAGLSGAVAVSGDTLTQTVTGLTPGKRYRLVISFTAAVGKVWAPYLNIQCPE